MKAKYFIVGALSLVLFFVFTNVKSSFAHGFTRSDANSVVNWILKECKFQDSRIKELNENESYDLVVDFDCTNLKSELGIVDNGNYEVKLCLRLGSVSESRFRFCPEHA